MNLKIRLIIMNFLQYAVWGAYLTCMGKYLGSCGLGDHIGMFYAVQGIVSIFMPALMGIVADRWLQAQKTLGLCHLIAGASMIAACYYGVSAGATASFPILFSIYTLSVAFYMPTIALSNSVAYSVLERGGLDTVKDFPPIRVFGTVGFICAMWAIDLLQLSATPYQFLLSGVLGVVLGVYALTLPQCPVNKSVEKKSFVEAFGLQAFSLFRDKRMAIFFIFAMLLGAALQITNGFATPFIASFGATPAFADTFIVKYSVIIYSISQIAETLCILLIPFCLKRWGIKRVMLLAMVAWVLRFGLFGLAGMSSNVALIATLLITSMIVYGFAFDFFNISGSLFVNQETDANIRSSAQGLFMLMTNGLGATIGTLSAQKVVDQFCAWNDKGLLVPIEGTTGGWIATWFIFAGYALAVAVLFALLFKYKHKPDQIGK